MNYISCAAWIGQGVSKKNPIALTDEKFKALIEKQTERLLDFEIGNDNSVSSEAVATPSTSGLKKKRKASDSSNNCAKKIDEFEQLYSFNDYDSDSDLDVDEQQLQKKERTAANDLNVEEDELINIFNKQYKDSDEEDEQVLEDDNLIVVGKVKDELCDIEVYIYNRVDSSFYVHHDFLFPSFPLCLEWMGYEHGQAAPTNYVAVGSMLSDIEVYDVDIINNLEPVYILSGQKKPSAKKKRQIKENRGHADAVLDLSWNKNLKHILASASADCTVKLWDLDEGDVSNTLHHHSDKVQAVEWHFSEAPLLLTGGFDEKIVLTDCKYLDQVSSWKMNGEIEHVSWYKHEGNQFIGSSSTGEVAMFDMRHQKPLWCLNLHKDAVTGLAFSCSIKGLLVSVSSDKFAKVWDINGSSPILLQSKDLQLGSLHCAKSCPDSGVHFVIGGEMNVQVMNLGKITGIMEHFHVEKDAVFAYSTLDVKAKEDSDEEEEKEYVAEITSASMKKDGDDKKPMKKKKKKKKKKVKQSETVDM